MARGLSVFLGLVLLAMFVLGNAEPSYDHWLAWLDLAASACAFIIAALDSPGAAEWTRAVAPVGLSIGLFVLWIVAISSAESPGWLTWMNFGVACAFLIAGVVKVTTKTASTTPLEGRFRRSA